MKLLKLTILGAAAFVAGCTGFFGCGGGDETFGLKVDHLVNPANVSASPTFSWKMKSDRQGAAQKSYKIEVRESCPCGKIVWQTPAVADGRSVGVGPGVSAGSSVPSFRACA